MGRPLSKRFFGTGVGNQIKIRAKIGTNAEGDGYIINQKGTNRYNVKVGSNQGLCQVVDKANGSLLAGEMTISVVDVNNNVIRVKNVKRHRLVTFADTILQWAFNLATGSTVRMGEEAMTLLPVITISTQPANQTVTNPAKATFTVVATVSNGATLNYQWTKGGVNISGATSASYTTPATATTDTGAVFACVVGATGGATSVTSSNATLTVS